MLKAIFVAAALASVILATDLSLPDLDGHLVKTVDASKTSVYIFTRTDCPISNRYAPEVRRIYDAYAQKGVAFHLVYVDRREDSKTIRAHMKEYGYPFDALVDANHQLVKLTGATITPEAAVFAAGKLVYRGRIDDRYVAFGKARQAPSTHDLEDVLKQVLAGKPPAFHETRSIGCFIEDLK